MIDQCRKRSGLDEFNDSLNHELPESSSSPDKEEIEEEEIKKAAPMAEIFIPKSSRKSGIRQPRGR